MKSPADDFIPIPLYGTSMTVGSFDTFERSLDELISAFPARVAPSRKFLVPLGASNVLGRPRLAP